MFVITVIFFPELFAPFWLILTPIRKGSIVFKGLLHLHYILCGSHSKAIKNQKKYSSLCWDLPSIIRFTNELLSRFFSPLMITFFPKWIFKYLFSTFILWVKRSSLSPRIYLMAAFSQENTLFLLIMTSNLSRGISDLHNFFFKAFPYSNTDICRFYHFWRSYLAI